MIKTALHSVGYSGVWGGDAILDVARFIEKAESFGFDGVEVMAKRPHLSPVDFTDGRLEAFREELASSSLELCCLASYHDFSVSLEHPDMAYMEKEMVYLRETLGIANSLGCPLVRVYSGYRHPGVPYEGQWDRCAEALRESCKLAEDFGVDIGLQNHSDISSYVDEVLALVEEVGSERLRVVLDAPLLEERREDLAEAVHRCGRLIAHSHTSDFRYVFGREAGDYFTFRRVIAVELGAGVVDYPTFIRALKEIGFDGYLSYEMCCKLEGGGSEENLDRLAKHALEYTRGLIRS